MNTDLVRTGLRLAGTAAALSMLSVAGHAAEPDPGALRQCSRIVDNTERLACFDRAMAMEQGAESAAREPVTRTGARQEDETREYVPLNDEVGRETLDRPDDVESGEAEIRGQVVRCETDVYGKVFFHFDNGQVWKQTDGRRLNVDECDFEVTISKDFFGYRMQPLGERRKLRISRVR